MQKITTIERVDGNGARTRANITTKTLKKVELAENKGAKIIINTNWKFRGVGYDLIEKLCQTNSTLHGRPKHIIWACYN